MSDYFDLNNISIDRSKKHTSYVLKETWIDTILGQIVIVADDTAIYLLEFEARRGLKEEIEKLRAMGFIIVPGKTKPIESIAKELTAYFAGTLTHFSTPYRFFGTPFQRDVWRSLASISYGQTKSYREQAADLGRPGAYRAVANANGANQLAIIVPCHRIISSDGSLGGYGGGISTKKWLLEHEAKHNHANFS